MSEDRREWWELFDTVSENGYLCNRLLLYGPPGTGKSTRPVKQAEGNDKEVYSVTLTGETSPQELIGHWVPEGDEFRWHDGPAIRAWREGAVLVINEIDRATGDMQSALHGVLDDQGIARMTLSSGETVTPDEGFTCVATTNRDPQILDEALRDRFQVKIYCEQPAPEAVKPLTEDLTKAVKKSYRSYEMGAMDNQLLSLRAAIAFQDLRDQVDEDFAAEAVFGNRSPEILTALKLQ